MTYHRKMAIFLALAILLVPLSPTLTQENGTENNGFNPNYLLSDEEMQDWQSMTRADIQAFLDSYGGFIAKWRVEDKDNVQKKTSDIIYRAAKEHRINPKYLLVKLQKEQSLITDPMPTQGQLDFATGYGCPDSGPCSETNRGFGKQVDSAAGVMRWYYDNLTKENWIKRPGIEYLIDGLIVKPANLATAFLYTYTPHLNGNKNFWKLWQKWFKQVYPDGTLVKTADNPTIYLIQNGKKRPISNMSVLASRFDLKMLVTIPQAELARYEKGGEISFFNYSILKENENYYLLDDDTLRPFASQEVVKKLGYHPDEIIEATEEDIGDYPRGSAITLEAALAGTLTGKLVRVKENKNLYYLKDNTYYPIIDEQIAKINFPNLTIENVPLTELQNYQTGEPLKFKNGTLLGIKGFNKIYVIENGKKRHISSEKSFNALGYQWKNIIWTDEFTGMYHTTGPSLSI